MSFLFGVLDVTISFCGMNTHPMKSELETSVLFQMPGGVSSSTQLPLDTVGSGASCQCFVFQFCLCSHLFSVTVV